MLIFRILKSSWVQDFWLLTHLFKSEILTLRLSVVFLPWWKMYVEIMGFKTSSSKNMNFFLLIEKFPDPKTKDKPQQGCKRWVLLLDWNHWSRSDKNIPWLRWYCLTTTNLKVFVMLRCFAFLWSYGRILGPNWVQVGQKVGLPCVSGVYSSFIHHHWQVSLKYFSNMESRMNPHRKTHT